MNMKQKWRSFWISRARANDGFTLVELIVVIAIIAVLGGVAVPAYSGYIEKADRAADAQLLADVNKAFAAACMVEGIDNYSTYADVFLTGNEGAKTIDEIIIDDDNDNTFDRTFKSFFDNTGAFKKTKQLQYSEDIGGFKDPDALAPGETITLSYGGAKITITAEQIQALKDSSFYGEGMTSEKLLTQVDNVALVASGMGTIGNIMASQEFGAFALNALGVTSQAELENKVDEIALAKAGLPADLDLKNASQEDFAKYEAAKEQIYGNALVLYTAQQTTQMGDSAKELLNNITSTDIAANMDKNSTAAQQQTGMNQAALAYGMYYAYVNSDACTDPTIKGKSDIGAGEVINALDNNTEFKTYMSSSQGEKDMEAYLEALSVVNSGTQTPGAVESLLTNGFVDLNDLLTGTMGK